MKRQAKTESNARTYPRRLPLAIGIKKSEMAVTYIFALGLELVMAFLLGVIVFRESASLGRIAAVGLVTAGIILLHR